MATTIEPSQNVLNGCQAGFDLSNYGEQLLHEREERTLTFRRNLNGLDRLNTPVSKRIFISSSGSTSFISPKSSHSWHGQNDNSLSPTKLINILNDPTHEHLNILNVLPRCDRTILSVIANDSNVWKALLACMVNFHSFKIEDFYLILNSLIFLFPLINQTTNEDLQISVVDEISTLFDMLLENKQFLNSALMLITVFSKASVYARDTIICYGIHTNIFELIQNLINQNADQINSELLKLLCSSFVSIFSNTEEMEDYIIQDTLDQLLDMLNSILPNMNNFQTSQIKNPNLNALYIELIEMILQCFTSITNHNSQNSSTLCEKGIHNQILCIFDNFESNASIISNLLLLIGNITVSQSITTKILLENGLLNKLFVLIQDEQFTPTVFWILSNISEIHPHIMTNAIPDEFISSTISLCSNSKFEIKKEASYFVMTCILFMNPQKMHKFITDDLILIVDEMLSCGIIAIINRCIAAMLQIILLFSKDENFIKDDKLLFSFITSINDCEMMKDLESLLETDNAILNSRVPSLIYQLQSLLAKYE
ncbi:hypothetical protein TRFO_41717 [Tritrichomonas foetus]|uniref:Uncharacterized protein n=1 Tax=Tritrichomonas foetus TaxID=1144522 RepID=A0A1J4KZB3_9EUKA|nr:hypothetical protein TRFO_41717 [Tritrichomonas foetus]|eukprot:OHT16591.1 hypothetical protein TRFO_41717 [Tritrichomonas foetus]